MNTENKNHPQSPEDLVKAAQEAAGKAAAEQAQALFRDIPELQMPDLNSLQTQIMERMQAYAPDVEKAQAQQLTAAGLDADEIAQAFSQNMLHARQTMQDIQSVLAETEYLSDSLEWEINRTADGKLSNTQLRLLALGAPMLVYNGEYVDSINCPDEDVETMK